MLREPTRVQLVCRGMGGGTPPPHQPLLLEAGFTHLENIPVLSSQSSSETCLSLMPVELSRIK